MINTRTVGGIHKPKPEANKYTEEELLLLKIRIWDISFRVFKVKRSVSTNLKRRMALTKAICNGSVKRILSAVLTEPSGKTSRSGSATFPRQPNGCYSDPPEPEETRGVRYDATATTCPTTRSSRYRPELAPRALGRSPPPVRSTGNNKARAEVATGGGRGRYEGKAGAEPVDLSTAGAGNLYLGAAGAEDLATTTSGRGPGGGKASGLNNRRLPSASSPSSSFDQGFLVRVSHSRNNGREQPTWQSGLSTALAPRIVRTHSADAAAIRSAWSIFSSRRQQLHAVPI